MRKTGRLMRRSCYGPCVVLGPRHGHTVGGRMRGAVKPDLALGSDAIGVRPETRFQKMWPTFTAMLSILVIDSARCHSLTSSFPRPLPAKPHQEVASR